MSRNRTRNLGQQDDNLSSSDRAVHSASLPGCMAIQGTTVFGIQRNRGVGKLVLDRLPSPMHSSSATGNHRQASGQGHRPPRRTTPLNSFASPACARVRLASDTVECSSSPKKQPSRATRNNRDIGRERGQNKRTYLGSPWPTARGKLCTAHSTGMRHCARDSYGALLVAYGHL